MVNGGDRGATPPRQDGTITSHVVVHPRLLLMVSWAPSSPRPVLVWGCVLPTSLPSSAGAKAIGRDCGGNLGMGTPGEHTVCPFGIPARSVGTRLATAHPDPGALLRVHQSSLPVHQRLRHGSVSCSVSPFYNHQVLAVNKTWMSRMEMFQFL